MPMVRRVLEKLLGIERSAREPPSGRVGRVRVGLITIIDEEFRATQAVFGLHHQIRGTGYFVSGGGKSPWDIALMQAADRSNVPVGNDVSNLMEDLRPQVLVLVGIAGGLCKDGKGREGIAPGDVVIADMVSYVEFLKLSGGKPLPRSFAIDYPSVPLRKSVGLPLSKTFDLGKALAGRVPGDARPKILIGGICSAEKVMGDASSNIQAGLLEPFGKEIAIDMESIGMARAVCDGRASFWYHPRYAIVRGISDLVAAQENDAQRAEWKEFAALAAATVAREFVNLLPDDP